MTSVAQVGSRLRSWLRREPKQAVLHTVLIVDGNVSDRESTARLVESVGYRSIQTPGLDKAMEQLEEHAPDVVLLGFDLVDGSGLEALAQMRQAAPDVPIVMLAGDLWDNRVAEAMRRGAVAYLARPFGRESLRELLIRH